MLIQALSVVLQALLAKDSSLKGPAVGHRPRRTRSRRRGAVLTNSGLACPRLLCRPRTAFYQAASRTTTR